MTTNNTAYPMYHPTVTPWLNSQGTANYIDPSAARLREAEVAFRRLWLAFLILAGQFVVVAVAAVMGWAR